MKKKLFIFGIISTLVYLIHVILGSILWKGYSNIRQPISDLTATGAPNAGILNIVTNISWLLGLIFILCAFIYLKELNIKEINISMILYLAESLITFSYTFFPEDMPGTTLTFTGFMHLAVTGLIVPVIILKLLFAGLGFRKLNGHSKFSTYSIVTSIIVFVSGIVTVIFAVNKVPFFGVAQRINIGSLELWQFIFALMLLTNDIQQSGSKSAAKNKAEVM